MKNKKPLTQKQKDERKQKIKDITFKVLHVISYVCTFLFFLIVIIGVASGSCSPRKTKSNAIVTHAQTSETQGPIFYPNDIVGGDTIYQLKLNIRNYNFGYDYFPNFENLNNFPGDLLSSEGVITREISLHSLDSNGNYDNGLPLVYSGDVSATVVGIYFVVSESDFDLGVHITFPASRYQRISLYGCDEQDQRDNYSYYDFSDSIDIGFINLAPFGTIYCYQLIEQVFMSGNAYFKLSDCDDENFSRFVAYYMTSDSFDFNGYQFGGLSRYLSTSYLFNRVYNGCFVYIPNTQTQFNTTLPVINPRYDLFKGLWEYHNTLYDTIGVDFMRASNGRGTLLYYDTVLVSADFNLDVNYNTKGNPADVWFNDIYNGANQMLNDYYLIQEIYMYNSNVGINSRVTLAYNSMSSIIVTHTGTLNTYTVGVVLNNNPQLYQTDSFINNNSILFYVHRIDYDKRLLDYNYLPVVTYHYYSDFFFATFDYTGLYGSKPPINDTGTTTIAVFTPIFNLFSNGLSGLMSLFNGEVLPGVTIGVIILIPFFVTLILATIKLFKR